MTDDTTRLPGAVHSGAEHTYATPLIGRTREFSALTDMLSACATGAGQMATIGGHAGVGKTRLAVELRSHSSRHHGDAVTWLWGGAEAHQHHVRRRVRENRADNRQRQ